MVARALTKYQANSDKFLPASGCNSAWHCAHRVPIFGGLPFVRLVLLALLVFASPSAYADYRITRDFGGLVENYKAKYKKLRDRGERVVIDGICNSACTLVLGIVPPNKVCVTPRAVLGFHAAYFDKAYTFGIKVTSYAGTADLISHYPPSVKDWISRKGGLTPQMKRVRNGPELWAMVDPCPDEY
jgi:hypothetical protein